MGANEKSKCWALTREDFRELVVRASARRLEEIHLALKNCELFENLPGDLIAAATEVFEDEEFEDGEDIIVQNEIDDKMYIILNGEAAASINGAEGEVLV